MSTVLVTRPFLVKQTVSGMVTNTQRYSIHDGPGIRTTVFVKGCNLRCEWCHNPECIDPHPELFFRESKCKLCGRCAETCPIGAINLRSQERIDREKCNLCMKCVGVCPGGALTSVGELGTVKTVFEEVKRDYLFYLNSHGGVTVSGGEPLLQPEFTKTLFQLCKAIGMRTAIETAGHASAEVLTDVCKYADLILYDVKHMDARMHKIYCGASNEPILENLRVLSKTSKDKIITRVPIVTGFNYSEESVGRIASFVNSLGVRRLDLLPYHAFAEGKYKMLGKSYPLQGTKDLTQEQLRPLEKVVQSFGLETTIGGW